jgi:spore maturation protein CgeB
MKILHIGLCVQPKPYNGFQKAFIDVVGQENYREISTGDPEVNYKAISLFDELKPDIVFMQIQAPYIINATTVAYFKELGCFVINWSGDKRQDVPQWMIDIALHVSLTSFSNMEDVYKMRALGFNSEFLEIGYDPEIYKPEGEAYVVPEIVFMGNNYGSGHFPMSEFRIKIVEFLQKEYGDRFGVYGHGWPNAKGNVNHSQIEEAKHYRGATIAINCSHFDCDTYNSDRILRIMGTSTACVTYDHKNTIDPGALRFNDFKELKHMVDVLLNDRDLRNDLRDRGNFYVRHNHTFKHQVQNIIKLVSCG